jgi:hypothetical protein
MKFLKDVVLTILFIIVLLIAVNFFFPGVINKLLYWISMIKYP